MGKRRCSPCNSGQVLFKLTRQWMCTTCLYTVVLEISELPKVNTCYPLPWNISPPMAVGQWQVQYPLPETLTMPHMLKIFGRIQTGGIPKIYLSGNWQISHPRGSFRNMSWVCFFPDLSTPGWTSPMVHGGKGAEKKNLSSCECVEWVDSLHTNFVSIW